MTFRPLAIIIGDPAGIGPAAIEFAERPAA